MPKWSKIKPGDILEWEETLCPHRGTYREHREIVVERRGKNIHTLSGAWLYWGQRGLGPDTKITTPLCTEHEKIESTKTFPSAPSENSSSAASNAASPSAPPTTALN